MSAAEIQASLDNLRRVLDGAPEPASRRVSTETEIRRAVHAYLAEGIRWLTENNQDDQVLALGDEFGHDRIGDEIRRQASYHDKRAGATGRETLDRLTGHLTTGGYGS
jgi:hypothetical protein